MDLCHNTGDIPENIDHCKRNQKNEKMGAKKRRLIVGYLRDYMSNSCLHGLRYISEPSVSLLERIFWAVMFVLSIVACAVLITNVWRKWDQSPVMVSFGERTTPVQQIPFPAVTICTKNTIETSKYNITEKMRDIYNITEPKDFEKYNDILILCEEGIDYLKNPRKYGNSSIVDNMFSVSPNISRIFNFCLWRGKSFPCERLFSRTVTNKGQCFTFNGLSSEEMFRNENIQHEFNYTEETTRSRGWSIEQGYLSRSLDVYPRRGRNFGADADLVVHLLEHESDLAPRCHGPSGGFDILLHRPSDKPRLSQYFLQMRPGEDKKIAVKVNIETISESLKSYSPRARQCYFHNERYLRYFKVYTQKNCELECRSNYTFAMCGCVSYYMPHNDSNHICAFGQGMDCVTRAKEALADSFIGDTNETDELPKEGNVTENILHDIARSCQCLQACDSIAYEADTITSGSKMDFKNYLSAYDDYDLSEFTGVSISRISVFFKDAQFISMRRSELYGSTDFLANCGGLLGLFHGFSVLSVVEIVYYLTLRIACKIRRNRRYNAIAQHHKTI